MIRGCDGTCRHLKLARYVFNEVALADVAVAELFDDFRIIAGWLQPSYRWFKSVDLLVNPKKRSDEWAVPWLRAFSRWFSPAVLLLVSSA